MIKIGCLQWKQIILESQAHRISPPCICSWLLVHFSQTKISCPMIGTWLASSLNGWFVLMYFLYLYFLDVHWFITLLFQNLISFIGAAAPWFTIWVSCPLVHDMCTYSLVHDMCTYSLVHKFMFFCHCIFGKHLKFLSILLESCPRKGPKDSI